MKELSIEEKAKRYDEVIPQLKGLLDGIHEEKCEIMEEDIIKIFPELKDSEDEDEKIREQVVYAINQLHDCGCTKNKLIAWIKKQGEQKPAEWSEEDKVILNNIIWGVHMKSIKPLDEMDDRSKYKKYEDFLKSLPTRFSLHPKQEWGEEDLYKIEHTLFGTYAVDSATRLLNKIKSLRPQAHWKPSEEQINALAKNVEYVDVSCTQPILKGLLEDLKKIREE